jgi:alpha-tubulin suppressor-like RCC1 family protein
VVTTGPTVTGFKSTPASVTTSNGSITLSATVGNASNCTFGSSKAVAGLPLTKTCPTSTVATTLALPVNTHTTPVTYTFTLAVSGGGVTVNAPNVHVSVAPGAGQPRLGGATALAATSLAYCAIVTTGTVTGGVDCWGANFPSGELGHGPLPGGAQDSPEAVTVASPAPGHAGLLTSATSLAAAGNAFCAVTSGKVACWGNSSDYPAYVTSAGGNLSGIKIVVGNGYLGTDTFCALTSATSPAPGQVYCWGYNGYGQLGNGTTTSSSPWTFATPVVGTAGTGKLTQVHAVVLGGGLGFCAIIGASAALDCWGDNNDGQLGNNNAANQSDVPVQVHGVGNTGLLSGVNRIVANGDGNGVGGGVCVALTSGNVVCWGFGAGDDLGDGSNAGSAFPVLVSNPDGVAGHVLTGATGVATDSLGSCAVVSGGGLDCWGGNSLGQLGNNSTTDKAIPVQVFGVNGNGTLTGVLSVTNGTLARSDGYCAVISGGTADCWGRAAEGETGTGNASTSPCLNGPTCLLTPTPVVSTTGTGQLQKVKSILGAPEVSGLSPHPYCALLTTGNVDCWGYGQDGELGDGAFNWSTFPVPVFTAN